MEHTNDPRSTRSVPIGRLQIVQQPQILLPRHPREIKVDFRTETHKMNEAIIERVIPIIGSLSTLSPYSLRCTSIAVREWLSSKPLRIMAEVIGILVVPHAHHIWSVCRHGGDVAEEIVSSATIIFVHIISLNVHM